MSSDKNASAGANILRWLTGIIVLLSSVFLIYYGTKLKLLGGSGIYLLIGVLWLISALLLLLKKKSSLGVYLTSFFIIVIWAAIEAKTAYWLWFPRIMFPLGFAMLMAFSFSALAADKHQKWANRAGVAFGVVIIIMLGLMFKPHGAIYGQQTASKDGTHSSANRNERQDWVQYGRNLAGQRYAPFNDINRDNVSRLKVAWIAHTGSKLDKAGYQDENTPLQVGDTLYTCTPQNKVFALDADSGKQKWQFDPKANGPEFILCRSLGYADLAKNTFADRYEKATGHPLPSVTSTMNGQCQKRIFLSTTDARLIALDAQSGKVCPQFGKDGVVDLKQGLGTFDPRFYFSNSGPLVIENGLIVLGARVKDNQSVGEPSGVIRGFDTRNGSLVWAWDLGNPAINKYPPEGETYTPGTPNVWTTMSADEALSMVYLPLGNATPDWWGGERRSFDDKYNSSVVALNYFTGKEKWHFQTTHHDIWDYDLPSQPTLYDMPDGAGGTVPALIQPTKRGEIFVLDRRTGKPLTEVKEKPAPVHDVAQGDYLSPTQPYSVGMPSIRLPALKEKDMWGMTLFDQLVCRVEFKGLRYDGDFTPQSTHKMLEYPGNVGGMNWGSATIDINNNHLLVNDMRMGMVSWLVPRDQDRRPNYFGKVGDYPQYGTPFSNRLYNFMSGLGVPCNPPPFGTMTAIDLTTKKIVWQVPMGTTQDTGPLGIKTHMPIPIGMPTIAGSLATRGNLIFFTGTQDAWVRAIDASTGKVVWKDRLPVGSGATPMSYISPKTGKQYIVFTASGIRGEKMHDNYVIAYSLE
ncbi:membrane-bound PQQ-dependent dehydrogenase, glucose/quinate/shikimate family [Pluralibacter gergoviae]|uniref:membrane-bound PQQ-dependent dehydrogenase, glucose/quinate/shikimate family n=1 Tax=Pluralibacter gergoviae TaxID=61647 RepID=UPI0006C2095B|nr:membrane-bound PQQ-dependent dehydrogenase, glucose/quinate/shikimate family [Pluralibacter gergoviae]KOQ99870.1 hypothetical protein ABW48_10215 [Pluralibacter gergoviae]